MTCPLRSIDHSLSASAQPRARDAGIILEPGSLAREASVSSRRRTRSGRNRNKPTQPALNCVRGPGARLRTSATGSVLGITHSSHSSSPRRGIGAKPSSRDTSRTAVEFKGVLRSFRAWLIS